MVARTPAADVNGPTTRTRAQALRGGTSKRSRTPGSVDLLAAAFAVAAAIVVGAQLWFRALQRVWPTDDPTLTGLQFGSFLILLGGVTAALWGKDVGLRIGRTFSEWRLVLLWAQCCRSERCCWSCWAARTRTAKAMSSSRSSSSRWERSSSSGSPARIPHRSPGSSRRRGPREPPCGRLQRRRVRRSARLERSVRCRRVVHRRAGDGGDAARAGIRACARSHAKPAHASTAARPRQRHQSAGLSDEAPSAPTCRRGNGCRSCGRLGHIEQRQAVHWPGSQNARENGVRHLWLDCRQVRISGHTPCGQDAVLGPQDCHRPAAVVRRAGRGTGHRQRLGLAFARDPTRRHVAWARVRRWWGH